MKRCKTDKERLIRKRYSAAKSRAKKQELEFNIELQDLYDVAEAKCPITNFDLGYSLRNQHPQAKPILVRCDCTKGFTKDNMTWVSRIAHLQHKGLIEAHGKRYSQLTSFFGTIFLF